MKLIFTKDIVVVAQIQILTLVHVILVLQEPIAKHVKNHFISNRNSFVLAYVNVKLTLKLQRGKRFCSVTVTVPIAISLPSRPRPF